MFPARCCGRISGNVTACWKFVLLFPAALYPRVCALCVAERSARKPFDDPNLCRSAHSGTDCGTSDRTWNAAREALPSGGRPEEYGEE